VQASRPVVGELDGHGPHSIFPRCATALPTQPYPLRRAWKSSGKGGLRPGPVIGTLDSARGHHRLASDPLAQRQRRRVTAAAGRSRPH
jgi:hypothetical protein